jgi:predicted ATPase/DNA-binding SARP family transcriptional activator
VSVERFESDKTRALLAYLVAEQGRSHSRSKLAGIFWPEFPERRARQNLSQTLYSLRKTLHAQKAPKPYFLTSPHQIQFNPEIEAHSAVDLRELQLLREKIKAHPHRSIETCKHCHTDLVRIVDLYQGKFVEGLILADAIEFDEWVLLKREEIHAEVLRILETLLLRLETIGELETAIQYARKLVNLEPWRERSHYKLIQLLSIAGKRDQAMIQYHTLEEILEQEFGALPEKATQTLYRSVLASETPPILPPSLHPSKQKKEYLPVFLNRFVGRKREIRHLDELLSNQHHRLITILGPGGVGKTRLAAEVARHNQQMFRDGVFLVELAPLQAPAAIPYEIANVMQLTYRKGSSTMQQLQYHFRGKEALLILDNFEHLLPGGAGWLAKLMQNAPGITVLTTSRTQLNIPGEKVLLLSGLSLPDIEGIGSPEWASSPAIQLFQQNAHHLKFEQVHQLDETNAIDEICRQVEGNPLGMIIAASWTAVFPPSDILARMRTNITFLQSNLAGIPERHQSVQAVFEYTWEMLTIDEQKAFLAISVFRGGFTAEAGAEIAGISPHILSVLIQKSCIYRLPPRKSTGENRFGTHELLRQYADSRLRDPIEMDLAGYDTILHKHCVYYLRRLPRVAQAFKRGETHVALELVETEIDNIQVAWENAVKRLQRVELIDTGLEGLCLFYLDQLRFHEGIAGCQTVLDELKHVLSSELTVRLWAWTAWFHSHMGETAQAQEKLDIANQLLAQRQFKPNQMTFALAFSHLVRGQVNEKQDRVQAIAPYMESVEGFEVLDNTYWLGESLQYLGILQHHLGKYEAASATLERTIQIKSQQGDICGAALTSVWLGTNYVRTNNIIEGVALMQEACTTLQNIGAPQQVAFGVGRLGVAYLWLGKWVEGAALLNQGYQIHKEQGATFEQLYTSFLMGYGEVHLGKFETLRERLVQEIPLAQSMGFAREQGMMLQLLAWCDIAENDLYLALTNIKRSENLLRQLNQGDDLGWTLALGAVAAQLVGDHTRSRTWFGEAMRIAIENDSLAPLIIGAPAAIFYYLEAGEIEAALTLHTAITTHPTTGPNSAWWHIVVDPRIDAAGQSLDEQTRAKAKHTGRKQAQALLALSRQLLDRFRVS